MRALHLIGLRGPGRQKLRFYPDDVLPLILPSWFSGSDREILLAFYQQILADDPLPRIEVDWYRSLVEADRSFLRHTAERRGSDEYLVVVKVRREGVDLRDVLIQPELLPFQYVAVTADHPISGETFGRLRELTRFVTQTAEELYDEMSLEFSLRDDGNELVAPLVQTLLNPILIVEAYNALVDVHAEGVDAKEQRDAIHRRILRRLLEDISPQTRVGLAALALRGQKGFEAAVAEAERPAVIEALRARLLIRDDHLVRWARWLEEPAMRDVMGASLRPLVEARKIPQGTVQVLEWSEQEERLVFGSVLDRLHVLINLMNEGQTGRVRDELEVLERRLESSPATNLERAHFWSLVGRLRFGVGSWDDAIRAFQQSLAFSTDEDATHFLRAGVTYQLGVLLNRREQWAEAEPLLREALRLENQDRRNSRTQRAIMVELARCLRDQGRWEEAESLFRQVLQLQQEEGDGPDLIGISLDHLARGLRDNDRWPEAETAFRGALHLKHKGADSACSVGLTMSELAYGLRMNGRLEEAKACFDQSRRLLADRKGETKDSHIWEIRTYALVLRSKHRDDEAAEMEALADALETETTTKA